MAWKLLTEVYGLPKDRLYVTYFEGDAKQGLEPDTEARDIWRAVGVADDHILTGDAKDNFWEMGATGPCGPCSEIHYDRIGGRNAAHLVNMDDPDVLEIWNNVFIQYNREPDGGLRPLPAKHIDTGMGYERLVSVLQDRRSNYDTDVFSPLFAKIQELTGARPYAGQLGADDKDGIDTAYRVIADHVRTLTIAISDGGVPDKDGRGYVLRRILRRGTRYARKYFNVPIGHFFSQLVPTVSEQMGPFFPEIPAHVKDVQEILDEEEQSFARTLDRGERLFEQYAAKAKKAGWKELNGKDVWRLYDTYGFPVDLTLLMAEEQGLGVNQKEFEEAQKASKEASKGAAKATDDETPKLDVHDIAALDNNEAVPKTDDKFKFDHESIEASIVAIFQGGKFFQTTREADLSRPIGIVLDKTNMYAEQGGQQADTGLIAVDQTETDFLVEDVQVYGGYVLHSGSFEKGVEPGVFNIGDKATVTYDELRRWPLRNNHTGTHILNFSLREVLGDHVDQKGSLVAPTKLRFDFSHKSQIPVADLAKIEDLSKTWIKKDVKVYAKDLTLESASKITGLRAVFGEAYPDPVRVVALEFPIEEIQADLTNPKWRETSVEFCGGTHVKSTGDIKDLVIIEESGIAKGTRRIVAVTGHEAKEVARRAKDAEDKLAHIDAVTDKAVKDTDLKAFANELDQLEIGVREKAAIQARFAAIRKALDAETKAAEKAALKIVADGVTNYFTTDVPNATVLIKVFDVGANAKALTGGIGNARKLNKSVYLFSSETVAGKTKVVHANYVAEQDRQSLNAKDWLAAVTAVIGGRGGGKADAAQGVGDQPKADEAARAAQAYFDSKTPK